jgi:glutamate-5-semialdehyde dehydrogenase
MTQIHDHARNTKQAAARLAVLGSDERNEALEAVARALEQASAEIVAANEADYWI